MLKQNENNLFRDRQETVRCLWFLSCDDLVCDWLHHNKHFRHISGVHANMITAVNLVAFFSPFLLKDFILPCCYPKKNRHYGRHNVKAWYSHDNSLRQAVPGTANLANEVIG